MNDEDQIWCEFVISGSDYTPIVNCLDHCYIKGANSNLVKRPFLDHFKEAFLLNTKKSGNKYIFLPQKEYEDKLDSKYLKKFRSKIPGIIKFDERILYEKCKAKADKDKNDLKIIKNFEKSSNVIEDDRFDDLKSIVSNIIDPAIKNPELINSNFLNAVDEAEEIIDCKFNYEEFKKNRVDHPLYMLFKAFSEDIDLMDDDELIVGRRFGSNLKESGCKLYDFISNKHYFGNLVGKISKTYSIRDFFDLCKNVDEITDEDIKKNEDIKIAITIELRSRFDPRPDKPYFLLEMLTQGNLQLNNYEIRSNDADDILNCLLLWRLKKYLLNVYKKGFYRGYNTFFENGTRVKGTIDFVNHIKINMGLDNGKIAYSFREKSVNNFLNHLILEAYGYLKEKYTTLVINNIDNDYKARTVINNLMNETQYPQYNRRILIQKNSSPISHPFYTDCEELRKTCLRILRDESVSLFSGDGDEVAGILYYVPDLWEEFLESRFDRFRVESQMEVYIFSDQLNLEYKTKTYPDFVFKNDENQPFMMLDAKYKPGWYDIHRKGKLYSKYLNDYDKCIRDMNSINAYASGTIFPYNAEVFEEVDYSDEEALEAQLDTTNDNKKVITQIIPHTISFYNLQTVFYTIPIIVPFIEEDLDFPKWHDLFSKEIDKQINSLAVCLEHEQDYYTKISDATEKVTR